MIASNFALDRLATRMREEAANRAMEKQAAERDFLQTLDWTVDQVLTYGERITGVHRRLCGYMARQAA